MAHPAKRLVGAAIGSLVCAALVVLASHLPIARATAEESVTTDTLLGWLTELSADRWYRWDNQLGAANFITDKKRRHAANMVTKGITISLAHPLLTVPFDPIL